MRGVAWLVGLAVALGGLAPGCLVHRVRVESEPPGAVVRVNGKVRGSTPLEFRVVWTPPLVRSYPMQLTLPGYRPVVADAEGWLRPSPLRRDVRLWRYLLHPFRVRQWLGLEARSSFHYVLVPEHGPSGTWNAEELL